MHALHCLALAGLSLTFTLPALCGTPASVVGHWQYPLPGGETMTLDFRPDGTEYVVYRRDGRLIAGPKTKDGRDIAATRYKVVGDKLVFTTLSGKHSGTTRFKVQGDTLTFPPAGKPPQIYTLRRVK